MLVFYEGTRKASTIIFSCFETHKLQQLKLQMGFFESVGVLYWLRILYIRNGHKIKFNQKCPKVIINVPHGFKWQIIIMKWVLVVFELDGPAFESISSHPSWYGFLDRSATESLLTYALPAVISQIVLVFLVHCAFSLLQTPQWIWNRRVKIWSEFGIFHLGITTHLRKAPVFSGAQKYFDTWLKRNWFAGCSAFSSLLNK